VLAEINESGTGIDVRSRLSGADFAIGENGGATATQLGLRTFTTETRLDDLNYGRGVDRQEGVDLTIRLTDGTQLDIDLSTAQTIGDVLDLINTAAAGSLEARLSRYGNGIELVDENTGGQALSVIRTFGSNAAIDLGLVPAGNLQSDPPTPGARAAAVWDDGSSANNELRIVANVDSSDYNGVTLRIHDDGGAVGHVPVLSYDAAGKVLDVEIENGVTTANDLIAELGNTPAVAALFTITNEGASTGDGTLSDADPAWSSVSLAGGQPETLTGADVHPLETEGLFTALLRMQQALEQHDLGALGRAINMLDACMLQTSFARAELGARQQGLDLLAERLDTEDTELRDTLSREYDVDFVEVTSRLTAQQTALQASLMSTGQVLQMTLLNYL
jgi:flagellar hook-associated protein 3 FlgL